MAVEPVGTPEQEVVKFKSYALFRIWEAITNIFSSVYEKIIEVNVNYDLSGGNALNLLPSNIDFNGFSSMTIQVFLKNVVNVDNDSFIYLSVSNNGTDFVQITENQTAFRYGFKPSGNGDSTGFIFIGSAEGVSGSLFGQLNVVVGGITGGTIEKIIFVGKKL